MIDDGLLYWGSAVAFNAVLSLFPLLLLLVSVAAWVVEPEWAVGQARELLPQALPLSAELVEQTVEEVIAARGPIGVVSLLALMWTGSRVFNALTVALNVAFDSEETYGFWKRVLYQLALTASVGLLLALGVIANLTLGWLWQALGPGSGQRAELPWVLREALPVLLLAGALVLLYRLVPRRRPAWRAALAGALLTSVLLRLARPLFVSYVERLGTFNLVYGSLAAVILLLLWAWLTALLLLFGGEVASHVQMLVLEGRSLQEVRARHRARSPHRRPRHVGNAR
jgi:membrane protein